MGKLDGLADGALEHLNNAESDSSEQPDATQDDQSGGDPAPQNDRGLEAKQTTDQSMAEADLSKFQKLTIDGKTMTYDELKKSIMLQSDYTRKMQEMAKTQSESQKYAQNLQFDLDTVRGNPAALAEFKKVYPREYHKAAELVAQGYTPQQAQQAQPNMQSLPPEFAERLDKTEQFLNEYQQDKLKAESEALNAQLEAIEGRLVQKYPSADSITAYTLAEQAREKYEQESGQKMTPDMLNEKFMEPFFKAAHDYQEKLFQKRQSQAAKQARANHERGSDIGRGGGTPGQPAEKIPLKNVADHILGDNGWS